MMLKKLTKNLKWEGGIDSAAIIHDIRSAASLLTSIPVRLPDGVKPNMARSYWAFGLIGVGVAAVPAIVASVLLYFGAAPLTAAGVILLGVAVMSGGIHHDGLADFCDSLGGENKARRRAIMKDSNTGSFAIIGIVGVSIISLGSIAQIAQTSPELLVGCVIAAAAVSRSVLAVARHYFPTPSEEGLAYATGKPSLTTAIIAVVVALFLAVSFIGVGVSVMAVLIGLGVALALGWFCQRWIGGVNGDGLGAIQQLSEAVILLGITLVL